MSQFTFFGWLVGALFCAFVGNALGKTKARSSEGFLLGFCYGIGSPKYADAKIECAPTG